MSSVAVDPIEKKPVFHYRPGSRVASRSARSAARCAAATARTGRYLGPRATTVLSELREVTPREAVEFAIRAGAEGVAFTYNEPIIWLEWVLDTGRLAREAGLFVVMVTNGYVTPAGLDAFAEVTDVWRVDIKAFSEESVQASVPRAACRKPFASRRFERNACTACTSSASPTWSRPSTTPTRSYAPSRPGSPRSSGADTPWHVTRFIPYLEFAELPPTPRRHTRARSRYRPRGRARLRLPRQRRCTGRRGHRLPRVRGARREPARLHGARSSTSATTVHARRVARSLNIASRTRHGSARRDPAPCRALSCSGPS